MKQKASRESTSQPGQLSNHLPTHSGQINNQIPTQLSGQIGNPVAPQIGTMGGQLATQISTQIPSNLPNQWTSTSPHQNLQSLETVRTQQAQLQEQIGQSELNLTAHHSVNILVFSFLFPKFHFTTTIIFLGSDAATTSSN